MDGGELPPWTEGWTGAAVVDAREPAAWTERRRDAATRGEWEAAPVAQHNRELELRHGGVWRRLLYKNGVSGERKVENARLHARPPCAGIEKLAASATNFRIGSGVALVQI